MNEKMVETMINRAARWITLLVISSRVTWCFIHPSTLHNPTRLASPLFRACSKSGHDDCQPESGELIPTNGKRDHSTSRRRWLWTSVVSASAVVSTGTVHAPDAEAMGNTKSRTDGYEVQKSPSEWRSMLTPTQYDVLRNGATERPYSSILEGEERPGIYSCAGCGTPLFESKQKFHSGTGWPSFARALEGVEIEDVNPVQANLGGAELRCRTCGGHLGDVFSDGFLFVGSPAFQSGKRFCIDGSALVFQPSNGEAEVIGDRSPPPKAAPQWLEPLTITPKSRDAAA